MNSARVAGGVAPAPSHWSRPEPQSPVTQLTRPVPSAPQPVRPQKRPDQPVGASTITSVPVGSSNPVVPRAGLPALESIPGQIVLLHLLISVNVALSAVFAEGLTSRRKKMRMTAIFLQGKEMR